ncbi:MAG TPA: pyridoxal phosphate-dependent aminotransferase, partial [Stenomitos sp.]
LEEIHQLICRFSPKVALVAIADRERKNWSSLRRMLETPQTAVLLDETDQLVLRQEAPANDVLDFLNREGLMHEAIVLAEIGAPETFPSFAATLVAHADRELMHDLAIMAEVTYSRLSWVVEEYFLKRVEEALAFSIVPQGGTAPAARPTAARRPFRYSNRIILANDAPAFEEVPESAAEIRLDYGENELPIPQRLVLGLLKGLFDRPGPTLEEQTKAAIAAYLKETRQLVYEPGELVLGQGVIPLLGDAIRAVARRSGRSHVTVALPRGHYGVFPSLIQLSDATLQMLDARPEAGFKVSVEALERLPYPPDALLLVNPNNPSGLYYDREELLAIAHYVVTHQITVLSDEIFALTGQPERFVSLASLEREVPGLAERVITFGGLSKEFAAGGLRVGYAAGRDRDLMREIEVLRLGPVDAVAMRAAEVLWGAFRRTDLGRLVDETAYHEVMHYLDLQRRQLSQRQHRLRQTLEQVGLTPEAPWEGGLFLLVPTGAWHGRTWKGPDRDILLDERNLPTLLRDVAGLRVNPGDWTGAPGHVRMVFSLEDRRFNEALKRLNDFAKGLDTILDDAQ